MKARHLSGLLCVAVLGSLIPASAASAASAAPAAAPAVPAAPKKLTVGIKYDQPGLGLVGRDGRPVGFDVDVATYVAAKLGVKAKDITWKEARSEQREALITSGAVDFVVATYSITAARKERVSFAGPYFIAGQDLLVRSSERRIKRAEDLNGRSVCTAKGSTSAEKIKKDFATGVALQIRDTYSACVKDLLAGSVDAVTTDDVILAGFAAQHPGKLKLVNRRITQERYGIGLKKGQPELQEKVTSAIESMIQDGAWRRSLQRHVTPSGYKMPTPPQVFNTPDDLDAGTGINADPQLVATLRQIHDKVYTRDYQSLVPLMCGSLTTQWMKIVKQIEPYYDTNLAEELKGVRLQVKLIGLRQVNPTTAVGTSHGTYVGVPDKYKAYLRDVDFSGTLRKEGGTWKVCGLYAEFRES